MRNSRKATIGILAPVDAGKTTLSEALLYNTGKLRKAGRVDHGDAFLDTKALEKQRGITIYSKQAMFNAGEVEITLLDTPGHMDFSAEMERTLQVLDAAVLLVSQADGVTGYSRTLWSLLEKYEIPVFIFVNKMDQNGADRDKVLGEIKEKLSDAAIDLSMADNEEIAVLDEELMEKYLEASERGEGGDICGRDDCIDLFRLRKLYPVYFGSALRMEGISSLIEDMGEFLDGISYGADFGAIVYKITRDSDGTRLTHMKITGGRLKAKDVIPRLEEKADRIRIYDGADFAEVKEAEAGTICAVLGLKDTYCGQGLGFEEGMFIPEMIPALRYQLVFPEGTDMHDMYRKMKELQEEDPQLSVEWNEEQGVIDICLMGEVQTEIIHDVILERYGKDVTFGSGSIVYMETIRNKVEGVGHYEPLRHYSEVHILLEPLPRGEGLVFDTAADNDVLKPHWQKLIISHMMEKQHRGVLTGSFITDMKLTILTGKDHLKHTEPGDMRQSTYRAIRHGLMKAESVLLEPVYEFRLIVPQEMAGRAMTDIQRMYGRFDDPETEGDNTVLTGKGPVSSMNGYHREVISYTKGRGSFYASVCGYEECHNADEVIEQKKYDPEADLDNQPGSIFCSHGAGFYVPWNEVEDHMHIKCIDLEKDARVTTFEKRNSSGVYDKELERIFERTYGVKKKQSKRWAPKGNSDRELAEHAGHINYDNYESLRRDMKDRYLIIDGYNCMFSWKGYLSEDMRNARDEMIEKLIDFDSSNDRKSILVFDGYKVKGNPGSIEEREGLTVVYTRENQTADAYIEKLTAELGKKADVVVVSSDSMVQSMSFGAGARRMTASELRMEIEQYEKNMRERISRIGKEKNTELGRILAEAMKTH